MYLTAIRQLVILFDLKTSNNDANKPYGSLALLNSTEGGQQEGQQGTPHTLGTRQDTTHRGDNRGHHTQGDNRGPHTQGDNRGHHTHGRQQWSPYTGGQ